MPLHHQNMFFRSCHSLDVATFLLCDRLVLHCPCGWICSSPCCCVCVFLPAVGYALLPAVGFVLSACCWRCAFCSFSLTALSTSFVETSFAGALVEELLFDLMPALSCGRRQRRVRGRLSRRTFSSQRAFVCAAYSSCPKARVVAGVP